MTSLPSLSEVGALVVLDISGSPVAELPSGMNYLTELIRVELSRTRVRSFPPRLVPVLCDLQELLMIGSDLHWVSRSPLQTDDAAAACIEDIQGLQYLSVLEITFANTQIFHNYIVSEHWLRLKGFKFSVGGLYNGKLGSNSLAFIKEFPNEPTWLPNNTSELLVMHCGDVTHLTMPNFKNLKIVDVSCCARLKFLFKLGILLSLQNLEEIVIAQCPNLEKVIERDDQLFTTNVEIILTRLRKLTLFDIPELRFISDFELKCDSMKTIAVWNCSKLLKFPILLRVDNEQKLETPQALKQVSGERSWLESLQPCPSNAMALLQQLFIEEPPPEELISRGRMMATSDI